MIFGLVLPWLLLAAGLWLGYQLLLQNGRIVVRLEMLEKQMRQLAVAMGPDSDSPQGLPLGAAAPEFELPDLAGQAHRLSVFRSRRGLLIFFNPKCGHCVKMAPELAALERHDRKEGPVLILVTTGTIEDNRRLIEEHGIRCPVLLQKEMEVAAQFQAHGTPTGYLIDEEGKIASWLAVGAEVLLELARAPHSPLSPGGRGAGGEGDASSNGHIAKPARGKANKGLASSRLNRNGLKAGTFAPAFRLPRLDGGELALEDYRGRRVLLVFSDPECGPCEELAPHLERFHRQNPDIEVLMISRGESQTNRKKAKALGLTFPVVLQRQWEISRLYGMFATPIAYLIDEQGLLAADVAAGVEPIRALMNRATTDGRAAEAPAATPS
jgi:peroxiredoxin